MSAHAMRVTNDSVLPLATFDPVPWTFCLGGGVRLKRPSHPQSDEIPDSFVAFGVWVARRPLPTPHRMPLVNHLGAAEDVVAVEAGGREAGVVGEDAEMGAGVEGLDTGACQGPVLLGQTGEAEAR